MPNRPETNRFDDMLLRAAPAALAVAAVCILLGLLLLAVVGVWTIKDAVW